MYTICQTIINRIIQIVGAQVRRYLYFKDVQFERLKTTSF